MEVKEFSNQIIQQLKAWKTSNLRYIVGVDVGATNVRVAVKKTDSNEPYLLLTKFQSKSITTLLKGLLHVENQIKEILGVFPVSASLGLAGPIQEQGTQVVITNYDSNDRFLKKSDLPCLLFPFQSTILLNDLVSTCYGIYSLYVENKLEDYFGTLWGQNNISLKSEPYLILAIGTGLGTGLLIPIGKGFEVLPLEFGHTQIIPLGSAHKNYEEEKSLIQFIGANLSNNKFMIEWEDICSGRGLESCYRWITQNKKQLSAPEISQNAATDNECKKALLTHYRYLFRAAQTQCIAFQAKGVFFAGDNQVANDYFVSQPENCSIFKEEFESHPKGEWLLNLPVYRQVKKLNLNLHGCLYAVSKKATENKVF